MKKKVYSVLSFLIFSNFIFSSPIEGVWQTECTILGKHSYVATATFTDTRLILLNRFFEDKKCQIQTLIGSYYGEYTLKQKDENLFELIHISKESKFRLTQEAIVAQWNSPVTTDGCGHKNWNLNQAKVVSGEFCRPFTMPKQDEKILDLVTIKKHILKFGRTPALVGAPKYNDAPSGTRHPIYYLLVTGEAL